MARARSNSPGNARELIGLVAFALAALVAISLLSFDPFDRSYFARPSRAHSATHNLAGTLGANLAHALFEGLGVFAYLLPVLLVIVGVRRLRAVAGWPSPSRLIGITVLWLAMSALLSVTARELTYPGNDGVRVVPVAIPAGGYLGRVMATPIVRWLGPVGSLVVLLSTIAGALALTTPLSFARAFDHGLPRLSILTAAAGGAVLRSLKRTWKALLRALEARAARRAKTRETLFARKTEAAAAAKAEARLSDAAAGAERLAAEREAASAERAAASAERDEARERQIAAAARAAAARMTTVRTADAVAAPAWEAPGPPASRPGPDRAALRREAAARAAAETLRLSPEAPQSAPTPAPEGVMEMAAAATGAMRRARQEKAVIDQKRGAGRDRAGDPDDFTLPPLDLLEKIDDSTEITEEELVDNAKVLVAKLKEFAVEGTVQAIHPGPVVTTYEFRPEAGVKYSKIVGLGDDLCLAMKAEGVRIDRISGKSAVGIEVPNSVRETISLRELLETDQFRKSTSKLSIALGKDLNGKPCLTDLRKMPHLLVAGATGAGKSVAVNCMIVSILYRAKPSDVRFIMVDPKRIELGVYDAIPHLLVPVVTDPRKASHALRWAVSEMETRYKRLANLGVRSLEQFNTQVTGPEAKRLAATVPPEDLEPLPYIVIIIDELADLMMVAANDVEDSISRLAAMARAVGIHLVLATQRPSVDVITGVIKANFPSRISFRVSSKVDSRTILDSNGAEMLLGKGDMLFMPPGSARLQRVHGGFISDGEVERLVSYLKSQAEPTYNERVLAPAEDNRDDGGVEMDDMYDDCVRVVLETGQASVSMLQRRLRLGYGRAARLVDMMELAGIVGPSQGAKGREILVDREEYLAQLASARG